MVGAPPSNQIGQWKGKADIVIDPLDDKKFYLGMGFLDEAKARLLTRTDTQKKDKEGCDVPVWREMDEGKVLSARKLAKGLKRKETTYLAALKSDDEGSNVEGPEAVRQVRSLTNSEILCPTS